MSAYPSPRFLNITVNGTTLISGAATLSSTLSVTGAVTLASTLNVTGATTLKKTYTVLGNYELTGAYSNATAPWLQSITLLPPSDLSTAPTASPRDLTYMSVEADTSVVYTDATRARYGNLVTIRHLHNLGAVGGVVANSWAGSRVLSKHTQTTRNHPREYNDPTATPASFPSIINAWREQVFSYSMGGTTPFLIGSKGRSQVYYGKILLAGGTGLTGGSNMAANIQYEAEWQSTGRGSARAGAGIRMNVLDVSGAAPPEGFIAYGGTRGKSTSPGWMTFLAAGVNTPSPVDPYNGDFVRAGASFVDRSPLMRRGVDISDITFSEEAVRWPGGDISGGARGAYDTGRMRVGPLYLRGNASGGVIDAAGYVGQAVGSTFTGGNLSGALNVAFGYTAPLLEDDYGGLYRGVLDANGLNLASVITLIPPMADGSGGAPSSTVTIRVRDEFGSTLRFVVTDTATTTSIPTNLSITIDDYFSDYGPWELEFLTGAAAGEVRAVTGYDAATGTLTTNAFSTVPTATLNLITNGGFASPFPTTENTILNGWEYTLNTGSGSVSVTTGICQIVGDGTNYAALDQEITVVDATVYYIIVYHKQRFTLEVGTTRGGGDILAPVMVPYTNTDDEYQYSEIQFTAVGTSAHLRFENADLVPVLLDFIQCGASGDALTSGIQARLCYPAATITQAWTARSALSIQPSGGALLLEGVQASTSYANDAAAAAGGVAVGQVYRNGSVVQVRIV